MADNVAEQTDLREEVRRLRSEQDRLREEQDRLKQSAAGNGHPPDDDGSRASGQAGDAPPSQPAQQGEQKTEPKEEKKKRSWFVEHPLGAVVLLIVLIAAAIAGFFLWQYLSSYESTDDAQIDAHINAVTSRINGTVVGVYAEDNQMVRAGQTLVDLDPRDFKVALEQNQAALEQAQASTQAQNPNIPITETTQATQVTTGNEDVSNALAALAGAKQSYESAVAQQRQAEANYQNAAADEVRYKQLVAKDEVSKEQYDQKLTAKIAQQAIVDAQRASADAAREQIAQREAALAQANQRLAESRQNLPRAIAIQRATLVSREADAQRAKANVDQALLNLSYTKIASPVTGVVGRRSVELGQQVSPGQELMGITNLEDIWVTANFKETQLRNIKPGQAAKIHVDSIGRDFEGYVESLPGASGARFSLLPPENATGNYVKVVQRLPVRIRLKSDQAGMDRLRPGMSVEPKVYIR
jgi:membrane fusion protein (multidrug efflux system)